MKSNEQALFEEWCVRNGVNDFRFDRGLYTNNKTRELYSAFISGYLSGAIKRSGHQEISSAASQASTACHVNRIDSAVVKENSRHDRYPTADEIAEAIDRRSRPYPLPGNMS